MQVQVLGCSGSIALGAHTTSFLIDGTVLLDAGTGVGSLPLADMAKIDHVLLTHSHLDHITALPLMLDSVFSLRRKPVKVHALPETLAALKAHLFNEVIWPDFTRLPTPEAPVVRFNPIREGEVLAIGNHRLEVLPACHTVPAVGFALQTPQGHCVFTGDTGPNPALQTWLANHPVALLIIEAAFSNQERRIAELSQHLCPDMLSAELAWLRDAEVRFPIALTHTKPAAAQQIRTELSASELATLTSLQWLVSGDRLSF